HPLRLRPAPRSRLFPYTTLFRSGHFVEVTIVNRLNEDLRISRVEGKARLVEQAIEYDDGGSIVQSTLIPKSTSEDLDWRIDALRSEEHTSELQSRENLVCRLLLE